jgi:hypothetical protein
MGRLLTLHYELTHNIGEFDGPNPDKDKVYLEAIKSNVSSPAIHKEEFAHILVEVFIELQEFQKSGSFADRINHLKENFNTVMLMTAVAPVEQIILMLDVIYLQDTWVFFYTQILELQRGSP